MDKKKSKLKQIITTLKKEFPDAHTALEYSNPLQLLISTILSAQCTDVRVNMITPILFAKYKSAKDFANSDLNELEQDIRSTGFYKMKARSIKAACQTIVEKHGGRVPDKIDELISLPGVGRKTANCVLGGAFGIQSGLVVDTHVIRLSNRIGLTKHQDADKIEQDLMQIVPQNEWYRFSNLLILHGRKTCKARTPLCNQCNILNFCDYYKNNK